MEMVGGGRVLVYPASDELPHEPGPQEFWQESFVLIFMDLEQKVGGFFRLGHEPNWQGGRVQFMTNVFSPEGVYHRSQSVPRRPQDRLENGFNNGEDTLRYEVRDGVLHWFVNDTDVEAHLVVDSFVPPIDAHRREGDEPHSYTGCHVDAAVGVTGSVTVKGKTWTVKGLGVRDHGWGPRAWDSLLAHRWTLGTFDRENSFVAMTFLTKDNHLAEFGWVIRGDKVILTREIVIRAIIGHDGQTNHGGTVRLELTTGEVLEARFEPIYPAIASWVHQTICYDSMCEVTWGGRKGFGCFETTSNIQGGTRRPEVYAGSMGPDGWYTPAGTLQRGV